MHYPIQQTIVFVKPFYEDKDIMHDFTHIERIKHVLLELAVHREIEFNKERAEMALYFHGLIYSHEAMIRSFLLKEELPVEEVALIIKIAWESQKESKPETNEGLMLHDAHMLEGGRSFENKS